MQGVSTTESPVAQPDTSDIPAEFADTIENSPFKLVGALVVACARAFISLTSHCLNFWYNVLIFVTTNHMKPSELRLFSIILLCLHYLFTATLGTDGMWSILLKPFGAQAPPSTLAMALFIGVAVSSTVALMLSTHLWFHLLGRIADDPHPSPLAVAGVATFFLTQSIFPCIVVLNGAYACWAGDMLWLCGGILMSILWAMPTVGLLLGIVEEQINSEL